MTAIFDISARCVTCRLWCRSAVTATIGLPDGSELGLGECRHDPPRVNAAALRQLYADGEIDQGDVYLATLWPITAADGWCSRYVPHPDAEDIATGYSGI